MITKKIPMTSFSEFVSGTESKKAQILRRYKFPNEEGKAMAMYYGPAKSAISAFHHDKHVSEWLWTKALELDQKAMTTSKSLRTKMINNARSVRSYAEHFGGNHYDVLGNVKLPFTLSGVAINVTPDMHVADEGGDKFLKFSFTKDKLKHDYVRAMLACMSYGLYVNLNDSNPDAIAFVDVPRGVIYKGLIITDSLVDEIRGNCDELEKTWNLL